MSFATGFSFRAFAFLSGTVAFPTVALAVASGALMPQPAAGVAIENTVPTGTSGATGPASTDERGPTNGHDKIATPDIPCLARTICAVKEKIRWQTPAWTPQMCEQIATDVVRSAKRHTLSPTLLLAIMINESDLNEKSARLTLHDKRIYAKDSGLMAIRCVLDKRNHCINGNVKGLAWTDVMDPATNIELGARELEHWRNGGAVTNVVVKVRDAEGHLRPVMKTVPCHHKDHAYWAHYNHGPRYIASGYPRHYPHRVAVLDHALATVLNLDPPELHGTHITIHDIGRRERTVDRPLEPRYKKLCSQIQSVQTCSAVALN